jgi:hypothetical protein
MATDTETAERFWNNFMVNKISRDMQSPYLDCFEGTLMDSSSLYYLTTNRDMCFKDLLTNHRHQDVVAN